MLGRSNTLKSARLRGRRRKAVIGKAVIVFCVVIVLWALVFWLSGLSQVTVKSVEVEGNASMSSSAIASTTVGFLSGRYYFTVAKSNAFFYPKETIENYIYTSFPQIEKASVGLKNFQTLKISITERQPKALLCKSVSLEIISSGEKDSCFIFDSKGFIFASSTELGSASPKMIKFWSKLPQGEPIGQQFLSGERLGELFELTKNVSAFGFAITDFRDREDGAKEAVLSAGERLIFSDDTDLKAAIANFQAIIGDQVLGVSNIFSKLDYIDLRFGNKVYYKLKN